MEKDKTPLMPAGEPEKESSIMKDDSPLTSSNHPSPSPSVLVRSNSNLPPRPPLARTFSVLSVNTQVDPNSEQYREFVVLLLVKGLHEAGCSTHRTETLGMVAGQALLSGSTVSISAFPTKLIVSFGQPLDVEMADMGSRASRAQTFHCTSIPSLNCNALQQLDDLASEIGRKIVGAEQARERLKAIKKQAPIFKLWMKLIAFSVASACCSVLFFSGGWIDFGVAGFIGCLTGLILQLGRIKKRFQRVTSFGAAVISGFVSYAISSQVQQFCPFATALSGVVWLLPGLSISTAVTELAAHSVIAGTGRFFGAIVNAMQLGFGLAVGSSLVAWGDGDVTELLNGCPRSVPMYLTPLWLLLITTSFNVLLNCPLSQFWSCTFCAIVGWCTFFGVSAQGLNLLNGEGSTAAAAFAIGVSGQILCRVTRHQALVTVLCGILVLVPGGMSVRGAASVFKATGVDAVNFGVAMTKTGFSITMGLIIAKAAIPSTPKRWRSKVTAVMDIVDDLM